jgi:HAD superfamily hydrolase (TIGR01549 family)
VIEVVSWDVDGTLYELPAMRGQIRRLALRRLWNPFRLARELGDLARLRRAMEEVRRQGGDLSALKLSQPREPLEALEQRWYGEAIRRAGPRAGVPEALAALRGRGLRLIVTSDYGSEFKLKALGLADAFERLYAGEALGHLKPSPRLFEHVISDLGIEPGALLHIGDRPDTDGAGAEAVGCRSLILPPGPVDVEAVLGSVP